MESEETNYTYIITINTGDYLGQYVQQDGRACLRFHDDNGPEERQHLLGRSLIFSRGLTNTVILQSTIKQITHVEIWMERADKYPDQTWFLNLIQIQKKDSPETITNYPFHRWITSKHVIVQVNDSVLPQNDKFRQQRREAIIQQKEKYPMKVRAAGCVPVFGQLSDYDEHMSEDYILIVDVYMDIFNGKPDSDWKDFDKVLGAQRLTGANPAVIRRVISLAAVKDLIAVTDDMLKPHMEGNTIEEAIADQRLYMVDYTTILHNITCKNGMLAAPIALFFVNHEDDLMPVAIQLFKDKGADNPVFLPSDQVYTWFLAKLWFNNADATYHQAAAHFGFTHLLLETIYLALRQTVSVSHPLFRLMAPHFLYTLDINRIGSQTIFSEAGSVDHVFTVGIIGMLHLIRRLYTGSEGVQAWRLNVEGDILEDIKDRGVENLPNYHFRDDALELHHAIRKYVKKVVDYHYTDPGILLADNEIQNWGATMTKNYDDGGCAMQGVPGNGKFTNVDQLIDTVTSVISTASVKHASVNFTQYEEYGYMLNYPSMLRGEPPRHKNPVYQVTDILQAFPRKETALFSMTGPRVLAKNATQPMGSFEVQYQYDNIGLHAVDEFQKDLKKVGEKIDRRNKILLEQAISKGSKYSELAQYTVLHPEQVPNATSV